MTRKNNLTPPSSGNSATGAAIDAFLHEARRVSPLERRDKSQPRLVFALDATMSRQPTWDLACRVQGQMFAQADQAGGLLVQLVYFRGFDECRSSRWVEDSRALTDLMTKIGCRGGLTQIGRVLRHVRTEASRLPLRVLVYVGDAMEEPVDELCRIAGELGLLGVKAFMFHEGQDPDAARAFQEIARLTGGAYARFDSAAPQTLSELLRAAAAYASRGVDGLTRLAPASSQAQALLTAMRGHKP
ncbi:VWA domain-containing protein [Microvirga makkahensis]|uniref:VWA domain-containing protein n=1 Tax=Microvirga makkahensis TaxID=1128670 RepID=A0A7X3MWK2_9HYPH|nr:VWA domain-containing protein [Microvirga makkahensis]MXQ14536.1 VWA domain-containing protein [Microvirga makkahensis]